MGQIRDVVKTIYCCSVPRLKCVELFWISTYVVVLVVVIVVVVANLNPTSLSP
jgi:hypothetical protein